jgi:hypothetical protein
VYYAFDRLKNVEALRYKPQLPLFWSLDFTINPMCSLSGTFWVADYLAGRQSAEIICGEGKLYVRWSRTHARNS